MRRKQFYNIRTVIVYYNNYSIWCWDKRKS